MTREEPSQSSPVGLASSPEGGANSFRLAASRQATFPKGTALAMAGKFPAHMQSARACQFRPLRRSRARFPFLSPTVTSSPGAGEVFPLRESQGRRLVAEVLGVMRKFPVVLLPLPLEEVAVSEAN